MKWIKTDVSHLPIVATIGNSPFIKPKVYALIENNIKWIHIIKITSIRGVYKLGKMAGKNYYWRVLWIDGMDYKTKEFIYLKEAKSFAEKILKKLKV